MDSDQATRLLSELKALPHETEWLEFKVNNCSPEDIGEYISACANSAALHDQPFGYLIWGVKDQTHELVGSIFRPKATKVGNEELENWLTHLLSPRIDFSITEAVCEGKRIVVFQVARAIHTPVSFKGVEYLRIGSYKKRLKDHPEKERALWAKFAQMQFETGIALAGISADEVLRVIDYPSYFELTQQSLPENRKGILERLVRERLILTRQNHFDVTNLGGILFAKDLAYFERLSRKALRVIMYDGRDRIRTIREQSGTKGYAVGFTGAVSFINNQLPQNEQIGQAFRKQVRMYPEIAVRELVANAVIHQDFSISGSSPMVEIFADRIEITNPGVPLISTLRFIDEPPRSRNESLAAFMRRINVCEERGSGIDKVVSAVELYQLPAPEFMATEKHTRAILFAYKGLAEMSREDRTRACYQHACLCYVSNRMMTNATLRKRFGIEDKNYPMASRIIADAIRAGLIKPHDPVSTSKKTARYVPFWL